MARLLPSGDRENTDPVGVIERGGASLPSVVILMLSDSPFGAYVARTPPSALSESPKVPLPVGMRRSKTPLLVSQTRTVPSSPPVARTRPSRLSIAPRIFCVCASCKTSVGLASPTARLASDGHTLEGGVVGTTGPSAVLLRAGPTPSSSSRPRDRAPPGGTSELACATDPGASVELGAACVPPPHAAASATARNESGAHHRAAGALSRFTAARIRTFDPRSKGTAPARASRGAACGALVKCLAVVLLYRR